MHERDRRDAGADSPRQAAKSFEQERALAALQLNDSLRPLLGGLAHHFNNLLGGILGWVSLASTLPADTLGTLSTRVRSQVEEATRLTRLVLSITRRASEHEAAPVCELAHWSKESLALVKTATPPHVTLRSEVPDAEVWAAISPLSYTQLLVDLLMTAVLGPNAPTPTEARLCISREANLALVTLEGEGLRLPIGPRLAVSELVGSGAPRAALAWASATVLIGDLGGTLHYEAEEGQLPRWLLRFGIAVNAKP